MTDILNTLGFTNVANSTVETFPPGRYNITLYAEFTQYLNSNVLSIYQVGTNNFTTILLASEGVNGYLSPPLTKTFEVDYQFGLSLSRSDNPPFRYFTELSRNPSGIRYAMIEYNLNAPSMFLIGWEDKTYFEDATYDDMVLSLQLQRYLQVNSSYDTPSGAGWYGNGTNAFASLTTGIIDHGNGTRRVFTQWGGDSSGTDFSKSNPILMNQNKTAIANWKTQYYLTVGTVPSDLAVIPGKGWYDENQKVTLTAPTVSGFNFTYWDVDGAPQTAGLNPLAVNMNGPHSVTAHYTSTFTLTIITTPGGSTTPPVGVYAFNPNSTVQVTAVANTSYVFDHWELDAENVGTSNPYAVLMNGNHTLEAVFKALPPPTVSIYPLSAMISVGQNVYFSSTVASGTPPYAYQWYLNGNPVIGATSGTWTFTTNTAGTYSVYLKITDSATNTAQSQTAIVTVITVTVGGTSFTYTKVQSVNPLALSLGALAALTLFFVSVRRKTRKRN